MLKGAGGLVFVGAALGPKRGTKRFAMQSSVGSRKVFTATKSTLNRVARSLPSLHLQDQFPIPCRTRERSLTAKFAPFMLHRIRLALQDEFFGSMRISRYKSSASSTPICAFASALPPRQDFPNYGSQPSCHFSMISL